MPIPNYRITDQGSFANAIKEPRQIAGLYFFQMLDALVGLAYMISVDFRRRPQLYRSLGNPSIATTLGRLSVQYGKDTNLLAKSQRNAIYLPIFGVFKSDSFPRLRNDLIATATAFATHAEHPSVSMLRESVRTSHRPFKDYLLGLHGDSIKVSTEALLSLHEKTCYPILRDDKVTAIFGLPKLGGVEYPFATDAAEDLFVEMAFRQLTGSKVTRERISTLQRVALRGAEAIATAIDFEEADPQQTSSDLDLLISKCYVWGTALASLSNQMKSWASSAGLNRVSTSRWQPNFSTAPAKTVTGIGVVKVVR